MQLQHCRLAIAFRDQGPDFQASVHGFVYQLRLVLSRGLQHVIDNGIFIAGMANADSQAPEILWQRRDIQFWLRIQ